MAQRGPIPSTDGEFNTYINIAIPYLAQNNDRLRVSADNLAVLQEQFGHWQTLFPLSQNPATRTSAISNDKDILLDDITATLRTIYGDIPNSVLTQTDRNTLNLKLRDAEPSPRPTITEQPAVQLLPLGGGKIEIRVNRPGHNGRAGLHPAADSIEFAYSIGVVPASPEEAAKTTLFTRAIHTMSFNIADAGKKVSGFVRYRNDSSEEKSGPWTGLVQGVIA